MGGECKAREHCLFCAFTRVALLNPHRLALLQPQISPHLFKEAHRPCAAEEVVVEVEKRAEEVDKQREGSKEERKEEAQVKEISIYKKEAGNPSEGAACSDPGPPSSFHPTQVCEICPSSSNNLQSSTSSTLPIMYHGDR
eukprot:c44699_g1_i1 orf=46-465(+)